MDWTQKLGESELQTIIYLFLLLDITRYLTLLHTFHAVRDGIHPNAAKNMPPLL